MRPFKPSVLPSVTKKFYHVPSQTKGKTIPIYPPLSPPSLGKPRSMIQQLATKELNRLDPQLWRRGLLKKDPTGLQSGDIIRIKYKGKDNNIIGYIISVDRGGQSVLDSSVLVRNQVNKTVVEMRVPIFSPVIDGIDILKKSDGSRERNKHYYIRGTKLDVGNLESKLRKRK